MLDRRRVGIFGGTFDPPHVAHVIVAASAIHQLDLDELIVTVAGVPWQKVGSREISPAETRLEMAEAAFANVPRVVVSDIELRRTGNSYTVDTLKDFAGPDRELFLLLGSDAAEGLDTWERPEEIAHLASIAVFPRRGYEFVSPPEEFAWALLELPGLEISSSVIRSRRREGRPVIGMTPDAVHAIIERDDLYRPQGQV